MLSRVVPNKQLKELSAYAHKHTSEYSQACILTAHLDMPTCNVCDASIRRSGFYRHYYACHPSMPIVHDELSDDSDSGSESAENMSDFEDETDGPDLEYSTHPTSDPGLVQSPQRVGQLFETIRCPFLTLICASDGYICE
jgi:hypothetical protein